MTTIKIVMISDTHEMHRSLKIPKCDLLIHAGDITGKGDVPKLMDFNEWLGDLRSQGLVKQSVIIAGNHDLTLEKYPDLGDKIFTNCHYLFDSSVEVFGLKIYGSPYTPRFYDWAFNVDRDKMRPVWDKIPQCDILITHGPPMGIGDLTPRGDRAGCQSLLEAITRLRPRLHVCGHIHAGYGVYTSSFGTIVVNASSCTEMYRPDNSPIVLEIEIDNLNGTT